VISCIGTHGPKIIIGVDTHKDGHVTVVIDKLGARMGQLNLPTTNSGYASLEQWACGLGEIKSFGG
jgi:transposase